MSRHSSVDVATLSSQCRDIEQSMSQQSSVDVATLGFDVMTLARCRDIALLLPLVALLLGCLLRRALIRLNEPGT